VTLSLEAPDGTAVGASVTRRVSVTAGFDTVVAVGLISALGLLLALGIYRNVRRRRQPRTAEA
jgi:membrane protein implicated in regulation of membrane protease activity